jgi:nucleoside diphosphate kinase
MWVNCRITASTKLKTLYSPNTRQLDECGIDVVSKMETTLSREDAQTFYEQHQGTDFFLQLIDYMTR